MSNHVWKCEPKLSFGQGSTDESEQLVLVVLKKHFCIFSPNLLQNNFLSLHENNCTFYYGSKLVFTKSLKLIFKFDILPQSL
jgi:hypothetical protein